MRGGNLVTDATKAQVFESRAKSKGTQNACHFISFLRRSRLPVHTQIYHAKLEREV